MGKRGKSNNSYTAAFKLGVVYYAQEYGKRAAARQFKVHEKCVRNWCKQRKALRATNGSRRAFRGKKSQYPNIEKKIIDYIRDMRIMDCKVTQEMCRIKAIELAKEEGIPVDQFKASGGWFQRMIKRNISSFENDYSEIKGQREIAAKREAGLLSDAVQEASGSEQIFISVPQTSDVQTYSEHPNDLVLRTPQYIDSSQILLPSASSAVSQTYSEHLNDLVYKIPQDTNITEVITCDLQDISTSQASLSSSTVKEKDLHTLSFTNCAVESSSTAQQMTSNIQTNSKYATYPVHITPRDTNITEVVSGIPQASVSSAAVVKDNYKSPFFKRFGESSYRVQTTANFRTYSRHNNSVHKSSQGTNITKVISGVPQDINSSRVSLSSDAVKSSSVTQTVLNSAHFTLPLVTNTDTYNLPIISNSGSDSLKISSASSGLISKDHSSILPINSTVVKDTNPTKKRPHHSVATQVNFDEFKKYKITKLKPLPNEALIRGRRIVDFQYFFRALKEVNNHSEAGCNLNNMIITSEKKSGICTSYNLKCVVCNFKKEIWSEKPSKKRNVNTEFVSSILNIKCSFQEANILLAEMHLPSLSHADFLKEYEKVCFPSTIVDSKKINQDISGKNVQSEPQFSAMQQCSFTEKNVQGEPHLATLQQCSSNSSSLLDRVDIGGIVVEDQIEIKEENTTENENEFETTIPDQRMGTSDVKLIDGEEQMIFTTTIKQEINSDDEDLTSSITNETLNKESVTENNGQSIVMTMLPQQNKVGACENTMIIDQEQANLKADLTAENIQDSNVLVKLEHDTTEITDKDNIDHFDKEVEAELPFKKARTETYKKLSNFEETQRVQTTAPSKEKNIFHKKIESKGLETATSSTLTGGNLTTAIASRGNIAAESPTSGGNTIAPSITNAGHITATSSITNAGNVAVLIPMQHMAKSDGNEALIVSQMPHTISSGTYQGASGAAFIPGTSTMVQQHTGQSGSSVLPLVSMHQSWANNFNTTVNSPLILFPGTGGAAYMTGVPSAIQQPANAVPNVNTATYLSLAPTVFQQSVNSSNNMPGVIPVAVRQPASLSSVVSSASGTTYVPLRPAVVQQPASSLNSPPVNTDGSRWIGRGNMNNNNPFCTLPGGAPKGVSDPTSPKSDSDQPNHQSKRPRFRCDDCDVSFAKHESWDYHKKIYCIKRLKLPPSSTVTNNTLVNNSFPSNCTAASINPQIEELLSAMAIRRSFLESSVKTALDAQYVINLHKSAQDLTRKSFKEFDNALNKEKALLPEASLEEQQIVSEARVQALIRAEAAYKQEKHSAAAVEQALYRQKTAIEATLAATGHEQTALISTLKGLKVQTNQNNMSSIYQTLCNEASFNQEKLLGTSLTENTEQQQIHCISSKLAPVHTTSHADVIHGISSVSAPVHTNSHADVHGISSKSTPAHTTAQADVVHGISSKSTPAHTTAHADVVHGISSKSTPAHTTAHADVLHGISSKSTPVHTTSHANVSHSSVLSEKFSTVYFEENKAVPMDVQSNYSPQYKEICAITSYLSTNSPSQNHIKFSSQKDSDLSVATSVETSSTPEYEKESKSHDYSHLGEPGDLNARVFSDNTYVTVYQADKSFTQRVKPNEMMDINITPLNETIQVLNCDSVPHNFLPEETKQSDGSHTLTKENFQSDISLSMSQERPSYIHHS